MSITYLDTVPEGSPRAVLATPALSKTHIRSACVDGPQLHVKLRHMYKILIAGDDEARQGLRAQLVRETFEVHEAPMVEPAETAALALEPSLVLLDAQAPVANHAFLRHFRGWSIAPVIVLGASGHVTDKAQALDAGADDYITKPYAPLELLARIRVGLRHAHHFALACRPTLQHGPFVLDQTRHALSVVGVNVAISPIEYEIFRALLRRPGAVIPHGRLLAETWGEAHRRTTHHLRVHIAALRRKIPSGDGWIETVEGVGYRLRKVD